MADVEVSLSFKGGGSVVSLPPTFSADGENVSVCWKQSILEYNRSTCKLVYDYQTSDKVIGFDYFVYDSYPCLITCSKSAKISVWRTMTHYKVLEKEISIKKLKTFNVIPSENADEVTVLVSHLHKGRIWFTLVDVKKSLSKKYNLNINFNAQKYFLAISGNQYFSVAHGSSVYFVNLNKAHVFSRQTIQNSRTFTCLACHPSEEIVLTGDSSGRVLVWRNIFSTNKLQAVFHWHTLPVRTVCFSTSGSYFYSGGEECVLVKWQLDNVNEKKFLPRLPAEIEHISVATNNLYVALATKDNVIRILDNQMNQINTIQHLVLSKQFETGITYDPRTTALIMNGNQGHLQFYSPQDMSFLYSIDIVCKNKITNERDCTIENTEIRKVAISKTGSWLATVEERRDTVYHGEIRLKFWKFNSEEQKFELNTSVEYPHEKSVNNILFQPMIKDSNLHCVTLGDDKKFKIWQLVDSTTVYKKGVVWKCWSVGSFRNFDCSGLSFCVDGSLMAIGFGPILTTWTPDSCEFKCSLFHPRHNETIKFVKFGYSNQSHFLVSASKNQVSVWNLLTLCLVWTVPISVQCLIADPLSTHMAILSKDREIFVFTPNNSTPVFSSEELLKNQDVIAATFVPTKNSSDTSLKWYERSHLYFINSDDELFCIGTSEDDLNLEEDILHKEKSIFTMITPNTKLNLMGDIKGRKHLFAKDLNHKTFKKFLEAPIHTMAPARFTCYSILNSFVVQKDSVS